MATLYMEFHDPPELLQGGEYYGINNTYSITRLAWYKRVINKIGKIFR